MYPKHPILITISFRAIDDGIMHKTKAVPEIRTLVQTSRNLVSFYNKSTNFRQVVSAQQDLLGAPKHVLIQVINIKLKI